MKKQIPLFRVTYLSLIRNSLGTKMFRNVYAKIGEENIDLLNDGEMSCAFFVSSVLKIFDWVEKVHITVDSTERDLINSGWRRISVGDIKEGCVIIWKAYKIGNKYHRHIGFYIGNNKAASTSYKQKRVVSHDITFDGKREIEAVYWKSL